MTTITKSLRLKVKPESYGWLNAAAVEVNQVWNWCNDVSADAADRTKRGFGGADGAGRPMTGAKFLSGFDLTALAAGGSEVFERIGADTIQRVCVEYATKRKAAKKVKLRWRKSFESKRSLGWIPLKALSLKLEERSLRFTGKHLRVFEYEKLTDLPAPTPKTEAQKRNPSRMRAWGDGCFAQDSVGDWWLCLPVEMESTETIAPREEVGIDLGLKTVATTSDGKKFDAQRFIERFADDLAQAQRRGHKKQAKRIHRKAKRCRADWTHKRTTKLVRRYQRIAVGDVNSSALAKTKMAKSTLDTGISMFRTQLHYKGEYAGRSVAIVNERNTTRACSGCGALTGPTGPAMLSVREWVCEACGTSHDRDTNAAKNILTRAKVSGAFAGKE